MQFTPPRKGVRPHTPLGLNCVVDAVANAEQTPGEVRSLLLCLGLQYPFREGARNLLPTDGGRHLRRAEPRLRLVRIRIRSMGLQECAGAHL